MRISVNLASRPFADLGPALRRLRIAMGGLAVAILGFWLGLHLLHGRADKVRAQERTLDVDINRYNQEQQGFQRLVAQPQNAAIIGQAGALNALIDRKAFSWTLAIEDLETVLPGGVQVTTLEPIVDKKDHHVTLQMRVVGPRDKAVELVANLEHSRRFLLPRIIGESAESTNGGNPNQQLQPVSASNRETFELLADYNPATLSELPKAEKKVHAEEGGAEQPNRAEAKPAQRMPSAHRAAPRPNLAAPPARRFKPNPAAPPPPHGTPRSIPPNPITGGPR